MVLKLLLLLLRLLATSDEHIHLYLKKVALCPHTWEAFSFYPIETKQHILFDEIKIIMAGVGYILTDEQYDRLYVMADARRDGNIDWEMLLKSYLE